MYVAAWLDNYDGDFGCYKVFLDKGECEKYLADMVMFRAKNLDVPVLDLKRIVRGRNNRQYHPRLGIKGVLRRIREDGMFELALRTNSTGIGALDKVTVGVREAEPYE